MDEIERNKFIGPGIEALPEVGKVKRALGKIGIFLEGFGITITAVYTRPRPYGFDFNCDKPEELLKLARLRSGLNEDKSYTTAGKFFAYETHGTGLREIGNGPRLHLEIALNGSCNAHIDSHGPVTGSDEYGFNQSLEHGYWDLLSDKVPALFRSWGERGVVGPTIRPMKGIDGEIRWFIGLTGRW